MGSSKAEQLCQLLAMPGVLSMPSVYDAMSAKPRSLDDMRRYCDEVPGHKMANMVEQGDTPYLSAEELHDIGYKIAIYPLTLLLASIHAMEQALAAFARGEVPKDGVADFAHLQEIIGFPEYYEMERRYASA